MGNEEIRSVIRARRLEILDEEDRVRTAIGIRDDGGSEYVGLQVFDADGSARAWLLDVPGDGIQLSFAVAGNQILVVSANDEGGELDAGASVTLCDRDGQQALSWHVGPDGEVELDGVPSAPGLSP